MKRLFTIRVALGKEEQSERRCVRRVLEQHGQVRRELPPQYFLPVLSVQVVEQDGLRRRRAFEKEVMPGALADRRRQVGPVDPRVDHEIVDLLNAKVLQSCRTFLELLTSWLERLRSKAVMHNDREQLGYPVAEQVGDLIGDVSCSSRSAAASAKRRMLGCRDARRPGCDLSAGSRTGPRR